jgi:hypothetical protein
MPEREHKTSAHEQTTITFSTARGTKGFQKDIAHASHYWPSRKGKRTTQKNLSKEAVGALSGIQPPGLLSSKSSSRKNLYPLKTNPPAKEKKKTPDNDALCSTPEPSPQIFSHTAHEKAQISNISRQR